jgi:glycosyltransferase involved in cell wall biosynthesis
MTTEGTYPHVVGGVSSWCDLLVNGLPQFDWQVLPIIAGGRKRPLLFKLPSNAHLLPAIDLWSQDLPPWRARLAGRRAGAVRWPAVLATGLLSWEPRGQDELLETLIACRLRPAAVRSAFRSAAGWRSFLDALADVLSERAEEAGRPPEFDLGEAAMLYQALYWIARTAAAPTPPVDVLHVTAAGWAAVPALVHKALHGTPLVLTEHGVYVREAYLASVRGAAAPGVRFVATRLARGLARAAYAAATVISPVTDSNARWEEGLGVDPETIRIVYNGVEPALATTPLPRTKTVVAVGRVDPLKDVSTMLRVAAEVLQRMPEARFKYYGPAGEGSYDSSCRMLHAQLELGDGFEFMGRTSDPAAAFRSGDVIISTSISEALPLSLLEAMAEARPIVATAVGGVPDVVRGCGLLAPPGDVHGLAMAVLTLLRDLDLAEKLGARSAERASRRFSRDSCLGGYADLLGGLASAQVAA